MTVPKFRAWTEEGQVMYYDVYPFHDESLLLSYDEIAFDEVPASEFILMQSTGLKDRNGLEIFEGDVVSWIDDSILLFGVVEFTKGMFLVNGDKPISEEMEVIGNIYQHPDLVED
ncbi:YopX family protein [Streptococcus thoraltensis]